MEHVEAEPLLSDLSTHWTVVFEAHSGKPGQMNMAVSELMCRYAGAVHRYLLKALKDPEAAAELDQEFAMRFLRGSFRHADPKRGRFRDYVKCAVQNLINDYHRRKRSDRSRNAAAAEPIVEDDGLAQFEQQFLESWRSDLLDRAWNCPRGSREEHRPAVPHGAPLPGRLSRAVLPARLPSNSRSCSARPLTPGAVRQALQRSRRKYVDFLLAEVLASLSCPTQDDLEEELSDLNLLNYCRPFMKRHADPPVPGKREPGP